MTNQQIEAIQRQIKKARQDLISESRKLGPADGQLKQEVAQALAELDAKYSGWEKQKTLTPKTLAPTPKNIAKLQAQIAQNKRELKMVDAALRAENEKRYFAADVKAAEKYAAQENARRQEKAHK